jgi:hypothetical protein
MVYCPNIIETPGKCRVQVGNIIGLVIMEDP